jgi:hypothetical protein
MATSFRGSTELAQVIALLTQANVAIPVVIGTVTSIVGLIRALGGAPPPLADVIADVERAVAANRKRGDDEIARLKALLAREGGP